MPNGVVQIIVGIFILGAVVFAISTHNHILIFWGFVIYLTIANIREAIKS